jgi:integrase
MEEVVTRLIDITTVCRELLPVIKSSMPSTGRSERTEDEYLRLAQLLIQRTDSYLGGLVEAVQDTHRPATFFKRMAALKFYLLREVYLHSTQLLEAPEAELDRLTEVMSTLHRQLLAMAVLQRQGMTRPRSKRNSKRQSLKGLPPDWRIQLCRRGADGKYFLALIVSSLLGVRPSELVKGIKVCVVHHEGLNRTVLRLHVEGVKVKQKQGQPNRFVSYAIEDTDPLVRTLLHEVNQNGRNELMVAIENAGNYSKEIQRLSRNLWPKHPESITAYSFRHQWSADVKAMGDADAASRGLGHLSAKTRRNYGTANQAKNGHCLRPLSIESDFPVMDLRHPVHSAPVISPVALCCINQPSL